jgi:hypothetical protein
VEKLGSVNFYIGGIGILKNLSREFNFGENRAKITGNLNENLHTLMTILVNSVIIVAIDSKR